MDTSRPIIALDLPSAGHALGFVSKFTEEKLFVKVGMELFYAAGPQIVTELKDAGHDVFCDLKLHDIPNTVRGAARSLSRLGADLLTVHAAGGRAMMEAALEGLHDGGSTSNVIAITQLTSTSQQALRDEQLVEALALGALPEKLVYLHAKQLLAVRQLQLRSRQFALLGAKGVFELLFFEKDGVEFGDLAAQLLGTRRFGGGFNGGGTARSRRFGRCRGG